MDKKREVKTRKRKINIKELFKFVPLLFVIGGLLISGCGALNLYKLNLEIGNESVEELDDDIAVLSEEYKKVEQQKRDEYAKNGLSDKFMELNERATELRIKTSARTNSRYVKETGDGNPDSLLDIIIIVPSIPIGIVIVVIGVVLQIVNTKKKKA